MFCFKDNEGNLREHSISSTPYGAYLAVVEYYLMHKLTEEEYAESCLWSFEESVQWVKQFGTAVKVKIVEDE